MSQQTYSLAIGILQTKRNEVREKYPFGESAARMENELTDAIAALKEAENGY